MIVDPQAATVEWLALGADRYQPVAHSAVIDLGAEQFAQRVLRD